MLKVFAMFRHMARQTHYNTNTSNSQLFFVVDFKKTQSQYKTEKETDACKQ